MPLTQGVHLRPIGLLKRSGDSGFGHRIKQSGELRLIQQCYLIPVERQFIGTAGDFLDSAQADTLVTFDLPQAQAGLTTQT